MKSSIEGFIVAIFAISGTLAYLVEGEGSNLGRTRTKALNLVMNVLSSCLAFEVKVADLLDDTLTQRFRVAINVGCHDRESITS